MKNFRANVKVFECQSSFSLFMPPNQTIGAYCFCPVCSSVVNFNLRYNFWNLRDRDFIFGMPTPLMTPFKWHQLTKVNDLDFDLEAKYSFLDFVAAGGIGAAVAEWLSSWLAEQEDWGLIPGLAPWIFRDWLSPASKSRYGWKIAKLTLILKTTNQPSRGHNVSQTHLEFYFLHF